MNTKATQRRALLALVVGLLALATGAHAQTTTTSSSSTTTSTTTSTTEPAVVVPCPASGCTQQPPAAFLRSAAGEVAGVQGSSCWSLPTGVASCRDSMFLDPSQTLTASPSEQLTLRFATAEQPSEVNVHVHGSLQTPPQPMLVDNPIALGPLNPVAFAAGTRPGTRWLVVETRWLQGSSIAFFKVRVTDVAPAPATPARLSVTG